MGNQCVTKYKTQYNYYQAVCTYITRIILCHKFINNNIVEGDLCVFLL